MNNEPIALQLADALLRNNRQSINIEAAAEPRMQNNALINADDTRNRLIRRVAELEARIAELEAQLAAVGAGGVEPLRKRECLHQITEPDHFRGATKLIAAARQALEALDWLPTSKHSQALWHRQQPALAAIREALEAEPQPAAQALDAQRYRFLRDGVWRDTELEPFIRLQLNILWDTKIDAAIAAQQGEKS